MTAAPSLHGFRMSRRLSTIILLAAAVSIAAQIQTVSSQAYNPCTDSPCGIGGTCSWDTQYTWTCSCYSGYAAFTTSFDLSGITVSGQTCV
ncbi:unnamed protein product, partial [Closterium sp. NIES-64]